MVLECIGGNLLELSIDCIAPENSFSGDVTILEHRGSIGGNCMSVVTDHVDDFLTAF